MKTEYVLSGLSYTRLIEAFNRPESDLYVEICNKAISKMGKFTDQKISCLFNGYVEPEYGKTGESVLKNFYQRHVDSGGLQIITRGMDNTPEVRSKVYAAQKDYDVAMSFDEIPLVLNSGSSSRTATNDRKFSKDWLEYAKKSGQNLAEQAKYFEENNSNCNIYMIAHGNSHETYLGWIDECFNQVPQSLRHRITGVALGSGALGYGEKEELYKSIILQELSNTFDSCHILGVGSASRLAPYLRQMENGSYNFKHLSYDSTSHSMCHVYGSYVNRKGRLERVREFNHSECLKDIETYFSDVIEEYDLNMEYKHLFATAKELKPVLESEELQKWFASVFILVLTGVLNFCKCLDNYDTSKFQILDHLSLDNFYESETIINQKFKSKKIEKEEVTNLLEGII